jgi:iron complex outermembrane receptor protein
MIERYINHFTVGLDAYEYVGNPNLRPEANHQIEWSMSKETDSWRVNANIYYSLVRNFITAAVDTTLARKFMGTLPYARRFTNIDAAEQYGLEVGGSLQILPHLTANADLAYIRARNLDWNEPLPEIRPLELNFGLRYERKLWWADIQSRWVDEQERVSLAFDESITPGFVLMDLRAGWEPVKGLSLGMAVLNILDRQYREHLNRAYRNTPEPGLIYEAGRNVTFFVKYEF